MQFLVADTFTASLARLTGHEQKAVKTTAFDLQMDPSAPGLSMHRLDRAKDPNFWSLRVNADIRIIVHKSASSLLLAYVDHHDEAYAWAERRRLEQHPTTGAMQWVEVRERVEEVAARPSAPPRGVPKLFDNLTKFELMSFGVPEDWVNEVRGASEETFFDVLAHLPQEAQEILLRLAVGEAPKVPAPPPAETDPFAHPDAQRRFRLLTNVEELARALDYPWEKWAVFLHPDQRQLVERRFNGPARVSGSAGTGKTIVALHRAVHLARQNPGTRVLLTTFSKTLARALAGKLAQLANGDGDLIERICVEPLSEVALSLYSSARSRPDIASSRVVRDLLALAAKDVGGHRFSLPFLFGEWSDVVDAWQLRSWQDYAGVARLGRKTRIGGKQREILWAIFEKTRRSLDDRHLVTWADVFAAASQVAAEHPFDFAVVDEAQDLGVAEARFLATICAERPDGLFFAGDLGQRIFQQPFSWKALGIDVRGRAVTLRVNYRTSHQIRSHADRLLPESVVDVDGNAEGRRGTVSVFDGPAPVVQIFSSEAAEIAAVGSWIAARRAEGYDPREIGLFVRSEEQIHRARSAAQAGGVAFAELDDGVASESGRLTIATMHLAKGLEFRAVAVMACDDEVLPLQQRIESVGDDGDLQEVYDTERHLLYVACTRARDRLLVTGTDPASEFLDDFG